MSARQFKQYLTVAVSALAVSFSAVAVPASEWYWVNDAGGTWDEEMGGVTSWRNPADNQGIPSALDDALLVLPYSFSFCNPDGCYTQPVQVCYRSDIDVTLNCLIIESDNLLFQALLGSTTESQLDLASLTEIIGGSSEAFTPPPSFFFPPDSPGIYPVGQHIQTAGTNFVRDELLIGLRQGSGMEGINPIEGTYELSGTASLTVGRFGFGFEKIGTGGDGLFLQSGGSHTVDGTLIMAEQIGGTGTYQLSAGNLEVETVEIIGSSGTAQFEHTGGINETSRVILGQHETGVGTYLLSGTGELVVHHATVGDRGEGNFVQTGGTHTTGGLALAGNIDSFGSYELHDGSLNVSGTTVVGEWNVGTFDQFGGTHSADRLVLGEQPGGDGLYRLYGGVLEVQSCFTVAGEGEGSFRQDGGEVHLDSGDGLAQLNIGHNRRGDYYLDDGLLEVTGREYIGLNLPGTFVQHGGRHVVQASPDGSPRGYLFVGGGDCGSYLIDGGELEADILEIGHPGSRFVQSEEVGSSTHVEVSELEIATSPAPGGPLDYDAAYLLRGGYLTTEQVRVGCGGRGLFEQTGDFHTVNGELDIGASAGSTGSYSLVDGTLEVVGTERIGDAGIGEFHHASTIGGYHHTVTGELIVGAEPDARGTYYLTGSASTTRLTVEGIETIGVFGEGTVDQDGGTHVVIGELILGQEAGSTGTYTMRGASDSSILEVRGVETIGASGEGLFHHIGGTHTVDGRLIVGTGAPRAIYRLDGGCLEVDRETIGAGAKPIGGEGDRFEHVSGTHRVEFLTLQGRGDSFAEYVFSYGRLEVGTTLTVADEHGTARFTQTGAGCHTVTENLYVGRGGSADGRYSLDAGTLEVLGSEHIGDWGGGDFLAVGKFVQDGTSTDHQVHGSLKVGPEGLYELHDGLLRTGDVEIAGGESVDQRGIFWQRGGIHEIEGTLHLHAASYVHPSGSMDLSGRGATYRLWGGSLYVDRDLIIEDAGHIAFTSTWFADGYLSIWGGSLIDVGSDSLHNHGVVTMTGPGVAAVVGTVRNHGLFDVLETTADFDGAFFNDGKYQSTSAESHFEDLTVGAEGYLVAGEGDEFYIEGDFLNGSHQADLWDTGNATLILNGSVRQVMALPGEDRGDSPAARIDNFVWGTLEVLEGVEVEFTDGNSENEGLALYVGVLDLFDPDNLQVLPFFGDATIYYNATLPENDYLGGLTYAFAGGTGTLTAQVPEPATIWLIVAALPFLWLAIRRRPIKPGAMPTLVVGM